jgi:photosystem II stability/assembly factor-like uncharacterized protein
MLTRRPAALLLMLLSPACAASWGGDSLTGGAGGGTGTGGTAGGPLPGIGPGNPWTTASGDLSSQASQLMGAGELNLLVAKPNSPRIIAAVSHAGLWASDDAGTTWKQLGYGPGSTAIDNGAVAIIFDPDQPDTFWESGNYGKGMFKTTDGGATFAALGDLTHVDVASVDLSDPARKTLLAAAHERKQAVFLSQDGGMTWKDIGPSLPMDSGIYNSPHILDATTFLIGSCGLAPDAACGVFRSNDSGSTWTRMTADGAFGPPLVASDRAIFWPIRGNGMIISADGGQTWTKAGPGPVVDLSGSPIQLPDHRIVALGQNHLVVSADAGQTWREIGAKFPGEYQGCGAYGPSFTYSVALKRFFLSIVTCAGRLAATPIYSSAFDYTKE